VVAAVLKRLAHRNPNVQLYALSLVEALSKNCGIIVHREIASKSFTQGLEKIITDRVGFNAVTRLQSSSEMELTLRSML
jgi:signal transducing adaptor molecule